MADANLSNLKYELKQLLIEECDKDMAPEDIPDDMPLLDSNMDLDSLDVLQICMAVKTRYGTRIEGSSAARKALKNINTLADTIQRSNG